MWSDRRLTALAWILQPMLGVGVEAGFLEFIAEASISALTVRFVDGGPQQ